MDLTRLRRVLLDPRNREVVEQMMNPGFDTYRFGVGVDYETGLLSIKPLTPEEREDALDSKAGLPTRLQKRQRTVALLVLLAVIGGACLLTKSLWPLMIMFFLLAMVL